MTILIHFFAGMKADLGQRIRSMKIVNAKTIKKMNKYETAISCLSAPGIIKITWMKLRI